MIYRQVLLKLLNGSVNDFSNFRDRLRPNMNFLSLKLVQECIDKFSSSFYQVSDV